MNKFISEESNVYKINYGKMHKNIDVQVVKL